jgi:hypothetical protein
LHHETDGSWTALGELTNNTGINYIDVEVEVFLYNTAGSQIASESNLIDPITMPGGATFPFLVDALQSSELPAKVSFAANPYDTSEEIVRTDLELRNLQLSFDEVLIFTGEVRNSGPVLNDSAEVMATFYNGQGLVVGMAYAGMFPEDFDESNPVSFNTDVDGVIEEISLSCIAGGVVVDATKCRVVVYGY